MKNIIILGNAEIKNDYSELIDSANFVVRFNEAKNYGGYTGYKADALCLTNLSTPGRFFSKYQTIKKLPFIHDVKEIWFPRPSNYLPFQFWIKPFNKNVFARANYRKHIISRNNLGEKKCISFSESLYANCCRELDIPIESTEFFPSTGYLAINYVCERFKNTNICIILIGFSFQGTDCHHWDKEKQKVIEIQNGNLIKLKWTV